MSVHSMTLYQILFIHAVQSTQCSWRPWLFCLLSCSSTCHSVIWCALASLSLSHYSCDIWVLKSEDQIISAFVEFDATSNFNFKQPNLITQKPREEFQNTHHEHATADIWKTEFELLFAYILFENNWLHVFDLSKEFQKCLSSTAGAG